MAQSQENESIMPDDAYNKGLEMRKAVVGKKYVEESLAKGTTEYWQPAQQFVTEVGWGAFWTRPGLDKKQRSLLSKKSSTIARRPCSLVTDIGMLIALKSWPELMIHTKGAIRDGLTDTEVREAVLQAFLYCGAPAGLEATRVTEKAIKEMIESGEYTTHELKY